MSTRDAEVPFLTIAALGREYRSRALSPVHVTELALERAERIGGALAAFVTVTRDVALAEARRAEQELHAGHDRGPLHGVPYALKDVVDTAGIRTTFGARPFAHRVPEHDADVVTRLRAAGAVLVGKAACVELAGALGCTSPQASLTGATRNPWDPSRWAGGSSSGTAAAIAAGIVPFAIGTETTGSLLGPGAFCGVTALRPTWDVVSRRGVMPFCYTMDKVGVHARSAAGAAAVLDEIRDDHGKPHSAQRSLNLDPSTVRGLRVGLLVDGFEAFDPRIPIYLQDVASQLGRLGAHVENVGLPPAPYREVTEVVATSEAADAFDDLIRSGRVKELFDPCHRADQDYSGPSRGSDYVRAMRLRTVIQREWAQLLRRVDVVLAACAPIAAPPVDRPLPFHGPGELVGVAGNLAGLPAVGLPIGFLDPPRLPVGCQLVGPAYSERRLLSVAAAFQDATTWHLARPPLA